VQSIKAMRVTSIVSDVKVTCVVSVTTIMMIIRVNIASSLRKRAYTHGY
jgi:hypothetical protein